MASGESSNPEVQLSWLPRGSIVVVVHVGGREYACTVPGWQIDTSTKHAMKIVPKAAYA